MHKSINRSFTNLTSPPETWVMAKISGVTHFYYIYTTIVSCRLAMTTVIQLYHIQVFSKICICLCKCFLIHEKLIHHRFKVRNKKILTISVLYSGTGFKMQCMKFAKNFNETLSMYLLRRKLV